MHADMCRTFIHEQAPTFALAEEFVASIDAKREDAVWQRFQDPGDVLPFLQAWLNGDPEPEQPTKAASQTEISAMPPKRLAPAVELAFKRTEAWIDASSVDGMSPREAARSVLQKLRSEL